jgi:hypothetical protein
LLHLFLRMQKIVSPMSFVHPKSGLAFTALLLRTLQERRSLFPTESIWIDCVHILNDIISLPGRNT